MIVLRHVGTTDTTIDGDPVRIDVDDVTRYLTVSTIAVLRKSVVGVRHRRLVLAAERALRSDAALRWQLRRGRFAVRLGRQIGRGGLVSRLCLPHLMSPSSLPLYPFQRQGVVRLLRSPRVLFADDMGLGKTVQAAAALNILVASGRVRSALVLSPATLVPNWLSELDRWVPELVVANGSPAKHARAPSWTSLKNQCHVIVTNYEDVRAAASAIGSPAIDLLILDEAHRVKNWDSLTSRAVRRIDCDRVWALTGTPLERDSTDLTSLLAILDPDAFTADDAKLSPGVVRARAARFVLRREKKDVLAELPPVVRKHQRLSMGTKQRSAYRDIHATSQSEANALTVFTRLREICDYDPITRKSVKIDRIVRILEAIRDNGEKAVVFSYLLEPLRLLEARLSTARLPCELLVGSMNAREREKAIARFKKRPVLALLASMRIASEGLTLVEANHVILVNRWWNPSLNQQAIDRVVRIGQTRRVWVHSFTVEGTVEDDLDRMLEAKEELFDEMIGRLSKNAGSFSRVLAEVTGRDPARRPRG